MSRIVTYGVCADCGAVAWELLEDVSALCLGCDPTAYRREDEDEDDAYRREDEDEDDEATDGRG